MKKRKVTYGVYHLVEWIAVLSLGKAKVKVQFTGGATTTQGVTPATYTTADPVVQFAIERSPEFRRGKIKIIRSCDLGGEVEIGRNLSRMGSVSDVAAGNPGGAEVAKPVEEIHAPEVMDEHQHMTEAVGRSEDDCFQGDDTGGVSSSSAAASSSDDSDAASDMVQVEFSCNDDAKDYLEQTFGFVRSKLRNREDIVKAARSKGVEIIFV